MINIPLTNSPAQSFSIVIEGEKYTVLVTFNSRNSTWSLSLYQNGEAIVTGVYLLGGIDVLKQYSLSLKNMYMVNLDIPLDDPTRDDFGITAKLFILTDDEVETLDNSGQTI